MHANAYIDWVFRGRRHTHTHTHIATDKQLMMFASTRTVGKRDEVLTERFALACVDLDNVDQSDKLHQLTEKEVYSDRRCFHLFQADEKQLSQSVRYCLKDDGRPPCAVPYEREQSRAVPRLGAVLTVIACRQCVSKREDEASHGEQDSDDQYHIRSEIIEGE